MDQLKRRRNITVNFASRDTSPVPAYLQTSNTILEDVLFFFEYYISTAVLSLLSPVGVITNILNIIVYCNQGIREHVNITFIALSFWDLMNCFLSGLTEVCIALELFIPISAVNTMSVQYVYLGYTRGCMYILSTLVTVYLSVERCICIMLPLKVKEIFTSPRVVLVNLIIVMFGLACFCPAWATQGIQWLFDPRTNMTRLELWLSVNRRDIDLFIDTFNGIVIPVLAQLLITVSGGFMIQGINNSAKFRQQDTNIWKRAKIFHLNEKSNKTTKTPASVARDKVMTNKDVKLTKVVVLLAIIFFACNLPVFLVAILRAGIPDLDVGKQLFSLYKVLYGIVYHCGVISSTLNIVVYYNVSTRYRKEFVTLFRGTTFGKKRCGPKGERPSSAGSMTMILGQDTNT